MKSENGALIFDSNSWNWVVGNDTCELKSIFFERRRQKISRSSRKGELYNKMFADRDRKNFNAHQGLQWNSLAIYSKTKMYIARTKLRSEGKNKKDFYGFGNTRNINFLHTIFLSTIILLYAVRCNPFTICSVRSAWVGRIRTGCKMFVSCRIFEPCSKVWTRYHIQLLKLNEGEWNKTFQALEGRKNENTRKM